MDSSCGEEVLSVISSGTKAWSVTGTTEEQPKCGHRQREDSGEESGMSPGSLCHSTRLAVEVARTGRAGECLQDVPPLGTTEDQAAHGAGDRISERASFCRR